MVAGGDDELEQWFRLESMADAPAVSAPPAAVTTWSSPRHAPDDVAVDSAPAGAALAGELARSRALHGGWRWSPEQKRLKARLHAQRAIGAELQQLEHSGARVLHARRGPDSAQPLDHVVVNARGVFVVMDLLATAEGPISWHAAGHLAMSGASLRLLEESLVAAAQDGVGAAEQILGEQWRVPVEAIFCIAGPWSGPPATTLAHVGVESMATVRGAIGNPLTPSLFNAADTAIITNAVARSFPNAA